MARRRDDIAAAYGQSDIDESDQTSTPNASYEHSDGQGWASTQPKYTETYSVHLTNLLKSDTAESLQCIIQQQLGFNIIGVSDILMHTSEQMCWICNIEEKNVAIDLAKKWNSREGERRHARVTLQEPEFCNMYRVGNCPHPRCNFDHVPCTAGNNNPCPRECPRGHKAGVKDANTAIPLNPYQNYRIKILGIPPNQRIEDLARKLGHRVTNQIIIRDNAVQIIQLKSIKYAKWLVDRSHNQAYMRGPIMKCQLELNVVTASVRPPPQPSTTTPPQPSTTTPPQPSSTTPPQPSTTKPPQPAPTTPPQPSTTTLPEDPSVYRTGPGIIPDEPPSNPTGDSQPPNKPSPQTLDPENLKNSHEPFSPSVSPVKTASRGGHVTGSNAVSKGSSDLPLEVPGKWKKCTKSRVTGGGEGEVTKICLNINEKITAAIKIYRYDSQTRKMRAYRELTALKVLEDLTNVSHLYPSDTDPVTNIPDTLDDVLHESNYMTFWAILAFIDGVTMKEYVTQRRSSPRGFSLLDALSFAEKLLCIVKAVHAKGVVHRDLKPDNIMVTFNKYADPVENAELFVVDYGQAYIATRETTDIDWSTYDQQDDVTGFKSSLGNRWYRVPQLDIQDTEKMTDKEKNDLFYIIRRSPTIDASSICAIFFWMITQIPPVENRNRNNLAPHQEHSVQINQKISDAVSSIAHLSDPERDALKKRLQMYLMTTFDKGFEFPERQWTVDQLDYRLKLLRSAFHSSHATRAASGEALNATSQLLLKLGDAVFSPTPSFPEKKSPLDKAASVFLFVKRKFIENQSHNYKWTDSSSQWVDDVHNMAERKHYDILTYYRFNQSWSILVCCAAHVNETGESVLLSIGSIVHGLYIEIPIGQYATSTLHRFDENEMYSNFELELKNLISLICKRKSDAQPR